MVTKRRTPRHPTIVTLRTVSPTSEGTPTKTIGELIVEQVSKGVDPVNAAGAVGVLPPELFAWMRDGQLTRDKLSAGADWRTMFTPEQQDAALFSEQIVKARAAHIAALSLVAEQGARGGLTKRRVSTKTNAAGIIESTEVVETTLPDMDMVRWKLERLAPEVYGSKATLNVNVQDMTDTDAVSDVVEQHMREVADQLAGALRPAIEATARDESDDDLPEVVP